MEKGVLLWEEQVDACRRLNDHTTQVTFNVYALITQTLPDGSERELQNPIARIQVLERSDEDGSRITFAKDDYSGTCFLPPEDGPEAGMQEARAYFARCLG